MAKPPSPTRSAPTEQLVPLELVDVGDLNMRSTIAQAELADLAASMSSVGLINAIQLIPRGDRYELVAGHRRCAAADLLGWSEIRARIIQPDTLQAWTIAWAENSARQDVTIIDQARWIAAMMDRSGLTQAATAAALGISPSHLSEVLATLSYPEHVQELVQAAAVTHGVARALMRIPDEGTRDYYLGQAAEHGCSVRTAEEWARTYRLATMTTPTDDADPSDPQPYASNGAAYVHTCSACHNPITGPPTLVQMCTGCAHMVTSPPA